ncbi:MAG: hypothetical protein ACE5JI_05970 [Acidobacteriota bacterium]
MRRSTNARGEVNLSSVLTLAVIAFLIYEAFQFVPVLFAQYEFKDAIVEEAKFSRGKREATIKDSLAKRAAELGIPVTARQIKVMRQPTRTRIQVKYQLSVEWLPGRTYTWDVSEDEESVLF